MAKAQKRKIVVIGGGSSYTPEIMDGLIKRHEELSLGEVWLVDIPEGKEKLDIVGGLARRMVNRAGKPFRLRATIDRREALPDADFIVTQMRVGGIRSRIKDERIPLKHGVIGQETTGPGGFMKALRTIPAMLAICRDIEELAPNAWMINFTNPSGIITETVFRHARVNIVGLCNLPIGTERWLQRDFTCTPQELFIEFVGCNHLVWINRVFVRGVEVTDELIERSATGGSWPRELLESLRAIPCGYHRYYYMKDQELAHLQKADAEGRPTRGEAILDIEKELLSQYADPKLKEKPAALSKRGGGGYSDAAVRLIASICNDRRDIQTVDTRNRGAIADLSQDSVVEIGSVITGAGPIPLTIGSVRPELRGLLQQVKAYEELTVRAGVTGDRRAALQALVANPLVPSVGVAIPLLDELLEANRDYLPQFFPRPRRSRTASTRKAPKRAAARR
jgi:6-phospho-beta-glucosidase